MIARRGLLGMLLGAPVAAGAAVNQAVSLGPAPMPVAPEPYKQTKLDKAFGRARRLSEVRMQARSTNTRHMPPHIGEKKSWSVAFKQQALKEQLIAEVGENENLWGNLSEKAQVAFVKKMGLEDLL